MRSAIPQSECLISQVPSVFRVRMFAGTASICRWRDGHPLVRAGSSLGAISVATTGLAQSITHTGDVQCDETKRINQSESIQDQGDAGIIDEATTESLPPRVLNL